ncbi:hypothetical protein [Mycobacterium avium]|uniref:hypothetical protein n=1 Tax=Mycobacterium avium TaxID=1764 RepID=UPI000BAF8A6E|nr:hypothetical protein [Mycobacterium avium]PBA13496.1 hypothetical protein CKJ69_17895 [Mycobacterium avium]PBA89538.1 hypothetical protein CKJ60_17895 [Mycobacterium avium]
MTSDEPVVYVDLYQREAPAKTLAHLLFGARRPQVWRWRAINAGNGRILAQSSEAYANEGDAIDAIDELFGSRSDVWLRQQGEPDLLLRVPINRGDD